MVTINTATRGNGVRLGGALRRKVVIGILTAGSVVAATAVTYQNDSYANNLKMIQAQTVRNRTVDLTDEYKKMGDIVQADHLGPRSDYLAVSNGNQEWDFPTAEGGQNRVTCEFSHFAYDDSILYPDKPGKAHLHMFFGNTHANAYSTIDTLENEGVGSCNGNVLNRSAYWVPAMFDGAGNVRIPERIMVYYKGEGYANGGPNGRIKTAADGTPNKGAQKYKRGMANIAPNPTSIREFPLFHGGNDPSDQVNYKCSNNFSAYQVTEGINNIPVCNGNYYQTTFGAPYPETRTVLEMEVKFWNCWDKTSAVTDWRGWKPSGNTRGGWFYSNCNGRGGQDPGQGAPALDDKEVYPNFSYFVNYVLEPGETTAGWHLSSDVNSATLNQATPSLVAEGAGSTHHGDAIWAWHPQTHDQWLANCVNHQNPALQNPLPPKGDPNVQSGCGNGYLSDGGPNNKAPLPGPALKLRPDFDTPGQASSYKVSAQQIFNQLCVPLGPSHTYSNPRHAAWCKPNS